VFGISVGYIEFPSYRLYINSSENELMIFIKELVLHGSSSKIYNDRLKLLRTIFEPQNCINNVYLLNAECNVSHIINGLLKEEPSCVQNINCSNNKCRNFQRVTSSPTIILSPSELHKLWLMVYPFWRKYWKTTMKKKHRYVCCNQIHPLAMDKKQLQEYYNTMSSLNSMPYVMMQIIICRVK